jgi:hypothetical protein
MTTIGTIIDLCILWVFVVGFTGSIDADQSYREACIVVFGVMLVGLVARLVLADSLQMLATPLQWVALYFLVDWACETPRKTTLKICGWYLVASITLNMTVYYLTRPR